MNTTAWAINNSGQVSGFASIVYSGPAHGFVRDPAGTFTTFKAPAASTSPFSGTFPVSINDSGEVTGTGIASGTVYFGFTQSGKGVPVDFKDPEAALTSNSGTNPLKINSLGRIAGYYFDASAQLHGFFRDVLPR